MEKRYLVIDPAQFTQDTRKLYDLELGALMRALIESSLKGGVSVNIRDASFFGQRTNGFSHIEPEACISARDCTFAFLTGKQEVN